MDKLSSMKAFLQVARLSSFSAAAVELGISKAMVSRHVSQLENYLDVQLINRTTRNLSLTEVGMVYRDRIKEILHDMEETELAITTLSSEPRGTLRVTAPTSFGSFHLARAIADYQKIYRNISIELILTESAPDIVEEGLDVAIRIGKLEDSALVARKLAEAGFVVCGAPEYLQKRGVPETPSDLSQHNCLVYISRYPVDTWQFKGKDGVYALHVDGDMKSNVGDALRIAAIQGCGLVQLPAYIVGLDIQSGRLQAVLQDYLPPPRPIYAVYLNRLHLTAKVRTFVDFLYNRYQPIPYWQEWASPQISG